MLIFMARTAKTLLREKSIQSNSFPKPSHSITQYKIDLVVSIYKSNDSSWLMPGINDFVSLNQADGRRVHVQK